jgi:hypothetical protein
VPDATQSLGGDDLVIEPGDNDDVSVGLLYGGQRADIAAEHAHNDSICAEAWIQTARANPPPALQTKAAIIAIWVTRRSRWIDPAHLTHPYLLALLRFDLLQVERLPVLKLAAEAGKSRQ